MKPLFLFTFWLLLGYVWTLLFNHGSPHRSYDPNALPTKMEIVGCHARFPLSEECKKSILKPCKSDRVPDRVTYAWRRWGDMDFILTVDAESRWDENAVGDQGRAFGYCQYRSDHNKWWQDKYRSMKTWQERLEFCHWSYSTWVKDGSIRTKLYWYNVRSLNKSNIKCYD